MESTTTSLQAVPRLPTIIHATADVGLSTIVAIASQDMAPALTCGPSKRQAAQIVRKSSSTR